MDNQPPSPFVTAAQALAHCAASTLAHLQPGERVLEAGCGAGDALGLWVNHYKAASVVGLEVVPSQQKLAAARLQQWLAEREIRDPANDPACGVESHEGSCPNHEQDVSRSSTQAGRPADDVQGEMSGVLLADAGRPLPVATVSGLREGAYASGSGASAWCLVIQSNSGRRSRMSVNGQRALYRTSGGSFAS
jgi:hypothetical protein